MATSSRARISGRNTNLQKPLGRFIGRGAILEAIASHDARGDRLVTLLGPPGMGKTRLAMRWGEVHGERYLGAGAGGVWFCDLTEARHAADVCATVARSLGLRLRARLDVESAAEHVGAALVEAGPILLILDNFEQIAKVAARTVEQWCSLAPEAFILVTSRERLGVAGEVVIDLLPLELPRAASDADELLESEAVKLYQERARAVGGWNDASIADVGALVRALDGIPLAIELAAARSRVLGADELLARLARSADVLADGTPSRSTRHATLRAAIDGSWEMLTSAERSALAQCSVFAGDFSLEAAEAIVDLSDEPNAPPVIDVVAALHDKSLVRSGGAGSFGTGSKTTRLSLYMSIREYASEHAAKRADAEALATRHRRYWIDATREPAEKFARTGDDAARAALASAKENLLAIERSLSLRAKSNSLSAADAADLARVVLHLEPTLAAESSFEDLLAMLGSGIAAASVTGDERMRGRLLVARGSAYGFRGQSAASLADLEAARELGRTLGEPVIEAEALVMASVRYRQQGRFEDARAAGEEALLFLDGRDQPRLEGACRAVLGLLFCELGQVDDSRRENLRARAIFHAAGDRWTEALALSNLAQLDQATGDYEKSAHAYDGALERFRERGDRRYESRYLGYRAGLELERGDLSAARAIYSTSLEQLALLRIRHTEGLFRACFGALEALEGHSREAMTELDRADDLLSGLDVPSIAAAIDVHRGQLDLLLAREAEARGDGERAERLAQSARDRVRDARLVGQSEDVRFAVRLLERSLRGRAPRPSEAPAPRAVLVVGPSARWFRVGDSPADLGRRGALRLVLQAMVERHSIDPGTTMGWEALLAVGWPGERVLPSAGATRVRVAISTLRRLGLAGLLVTRDDGYLLDPRVVVRKEPDV